MLEIAWVGNEVRLTVLAVGRGAEERSVLPEDGRDEVHVVEEVGGDEEVVLR